MKVRVKIYVSGDVQGVFFRHYTKKMARSLNVNGWCRNNPDGTVIIVAEGEDKEINELAKWCKIGSPMAKVREVKVDQEKFTGSEQRFEVR